MKKIPGCFVINLLAINTMILLCILGCGNVSKSHMDEVVIPIQDFMVNEQTCTENITEICIDLFEKAAEDRKLNDLETVRVIVNRLGEAGYAAIDSKNQIDMTNAE